jgi:hypothetical protein
MMRRETERRMIRRWGIHGTGGSFLKHFLKGLSSNPINKEKLAVYWPAVPFRVPPLSIKIRTRNTHISDI